MMSAQLGAFLRASPKSRMAFGTSIFCGQAFAHWPQAMQSSGRLPSGRKSTRYVMFRFRLPAMRYSL